MGTGCRSAGGLRGNPVPPISAPMGTHAKMRFPQYVACGQVYKNTKNAYRSMAEKEPHSRDLLCRNGGNMIRALP
jgi:hypothetical protein